MKKRTRIALTIAVMIAAISCVAGYAIYNYCKETIKPMRGGIYYDPVEDTDAYKAVAYEVDQQTKTEMIEARYPDFATRTDFEGMTIDSIYNSHVVRFGICHKYWRIKKAILLEDYNIEWRTPAEMNPQICFD